MNDANREAGDDRSGAFVERFQVEPYAAGILDGLTFAVKDLIDVAGRITGCGNPSWRDSHPSAPVSAVCVEQLLGAGGRLVGATVSDELAFSLLGENHFHGTPRNPWDAERVPGGSSSGSASAVAHGLCDFALGTDTGGSVRVPGANCGLFALRPSHGVISVAGVNPFAPTFDTVGVFARTPDVLRRAAEVLLGGVDDRPVPLTAMVVLDDAFALADPEVRTVVEAAVAETATRLNLPVEHVGLREIDGEGEEPGLGAWYDTYCLLQWSEIWSCLGPWVEDEHPEFGPVTAQNFALVKGVDRAKISAAVAQRERLARRINAFLRPGLLLALPTTPAIAPRRSTIGVRSQAVGDYYPRALSLTSVAGIGRLPQITMPVGLVDGLPAGISLLTAHGGDTELLGVACVVGKELRADS